MGPRLYCYALQIVCIGPKVLFRGLKKNSPGSLQSAVILIAGLPSVIQNVLRRGYKQNSPGSLRSPGIFLYRNLEEYFSCGQKKSRTLVRDYFVCAQDWIRTSTPFPALPPQGSASTNFATWAEEKMLVPRTGLEPAHLTAPPPEDGASTNFAIWAFIVSFKNNCFLLLFLRTGVQT